MKIEERIAKAQTAWGEGIVRIGKTGVSNPNEVERVTNEMLDSLYDFRVGAETSILFKPTVATEHPFRINREETISYFIRGSISEDNGFALTPWKEVNFGRSHFLELNGHVLVMGEYTFVDYQNDGTIVDYTFAYKEDDAGDLKIILHHSSLRF